MGIMEKRYERLVQKYHGANTEKQKSEMKVTPGADRGRAMTMTGKPKNLKKTITRLANYLVYQKTLLIVAICCGLVNTGTTLAGSYLLRPIINTFIYYPTSLWF